MRNYKIAFFTTDWNYELVEMTLHGLKKFVEDHENVQLCVFDCFGKDQDTPKDRSEYAVFDLAELDHFDGALIQGNQIVLNAIRQSIARRIAAANIPAVTIDCPIEGCTLITVDNQKAQRAIVDHVIKDHGARRMVYLTGIIGNGCPEAEQRLDGFLDACRENGIPSEDLEIIHCTWRTSDGMEIAERWIREDRPFPDAFICANDDMALGMITILKEKGVHVPSDVIVTGFDNISSSELSSPRLSTIHRDYAMLNYRAMELLIDKINGIEYPPLVPFQYEIIRSESCGCSAMSRSSYIRDKYFHQTRFLKDFYNLQDEMAAELFEASNLSELKDIIERNHSIFGCENVYLCVNAYYYDSYEKDQWQREVEGFDKSMILAACGRRDNATAQSCLYARFPTCDLLPKVLMHAHRFLMFYPLHYNTYSIGYIAMDGISEAAKMNLHMSIFSFLEIAIENLRKKGLLRHLNHVLDDLYVHDALTGLYNRFGYDRFAPSTYDAFMTGDGGAQIMFIDMDGMKGINDRFGHEMGDAAIRATAEALKAACDCKDFLMRYGGDEFLVIASQKSTALESAIQGEIRKRNARRDMPFDLRLSIGIVHSDDVRGRTLDECVQTADAQMYERKKRRKAALA